MALAYGLGALLVFPLVTGARVVLTDGFDADVLLRTIERERVTIFFGTATCYRLFLRIPELTTRFDLRSLRACVSAGEPLDADTSAAWQQLTGVDLLDGLGTTELFHIVLSQRLGHITHGALGTPVPGYEARVVDARMHDVADGTPGRLAVRGVTRCRYWNSPDAERDYFRDGWNVTGDVVTRDAEGQYWFKHRADDLIVSAGYNIAGAEIESVLLTHPAVAAAAVVAVPDIIRGAVPKAVVVARTEGTPRLVLALQEHVQRFLAGYKTPRQIQFLSTLPRGSDGKVDKTALRDL
jgi:2-aminobenzoate-CoA ligase